MNENFDPKKIIDFSKDYYFILGINKNDLPIKNDRDSKVKLSKIIEEAFRKQARKCHPDFGGSKDAFLDLVRARRVLEDTFLKKIYDQGYYDELQLNIADNSFDVDWSKIGTYRKGTIEDTVGFKLFLKISDLKNELNITPAFFPEKDEHNYEWDWVINDTENKLVLSLVNDENEVLRLSNGIDIENSLPFKIYLCIPKANLNLVRNNNNINDPHGRIMINAKINQVQYNDYDLLECTSLDHAFEYISENLNKDLNKIRNNTFINTQNKNETKWLDTEKLNKLDKLQLDNLINFKYFKFENDENAGDFLDSIDSE